MVSGFIPSEDCKVHVGQHGNQGGFTLIELLVVLAIVALLLSVAMPRYFSSLERSKETILRQDLQVLRTTIDKYFADTGAYPDNLEELVEREYLRAIPVDPITENNASWVLLPPKDSEYHGVFDVRSGAPGVSRDGIAFSEM